VDWEFAMTCWDAHNHLAHPHLRGYLPELLRDLPGLGVRGGVVNGTHPRDWAAVRELCADFPQWIPAYGVHPWEVEDLPEDWFLRWEQFLREDSRATVGEIGLDLWRTRENFARQLEVFTRQWNQAAEWGRPVTVHCLRAWEQMRAFFRSAPCLLGGFLLHAYGGPENEVDFWVSRGAYFSFSPSFLGRERKMRAFRRIPLERLLLETDAPSMGAPDGCGVHRLPPAMDGSPVHDPRNLPAAAWQLARELQIDPARLFAETSANFLRLFGPSGWIGL
jgi:TatD DNase family protein